MKTMTRWLAFGISAAALQFFFACNKKNSSNSNPTIPPGKSQVSIYIMDAPVQFSKVLIDIRQVAVLVDSADQQKNDDRDGQWDDGYCGWHRDKENKSVFWDTLNITPGVYDLLQLRNGVDTLLATGIIPGGKILKVKVTLGSDNTIYMDSTTHYPLEVFGPHPYFTINVRRVDVSDVSANDFKLWLDFNLQRSVFFWNGEFLLKPYIVVFNDQITAKIKGQALPGRKVVLVTAYNATDTLYAVPNWINGGYMMRNVPEGTYSINFKGRDGYSDTTITNISVGAAKTVKVQDVTLHK
jgi:hypothetical protein